MHCKKCGSEYAEVKEEYISIDGLKTQTIYCAECQASYKTESNTGFKSIVSFGSYSDKTTHSLGKLNGQFVLLPLKQGVKNGFVNIKWARFAGGNSISLSYHDSWDTEHIYGISNVRFNIPKYEEQFKSSELYHLKDQAYEGKVRKLTDDFADELNAILKQAAGSDILGLSEKKEEIQSNKKSSVPTGPVIFCGVLALILSFTGFGIIPAIIGLILYSRAVIYDLWGPIEFGRILCILSIICSIIFPFFFWGSL